MHNNLDKYLFFYSEANLGKTKELNNEGTKIQFKRAFKSCSFLLPKKQ